MIDAARLSARARLARLQGGACLAAWCCAASLRACCPSARHGGAWPAGRAAAQRKEFAGLGKAINKSPLALAQQASRGRVLFVRSALGRCVDVALLGYLVRQPAKLAHFFPATARAVELALAARPRCCRR